MYYKVLVGGVEYGMGDIASVTIERPLFDKLGAGNVCSAELEMTFWPTEDVPRMAEIIPFARSNEEDTWTQLGVFYTDVRSTDSGGKMTLIAYDSMLMAEMKWAPEDERRFPMTMPDAVSEIASLLGIGIDSRTVLNESYTVDFPATAYTLRDILKYIGAAHCGNWIITANNELLLLPLFGSMPEETNFLVNEDGDAITFGGVRILV